MRKTRWWKEFHRIARVGRLVLFWDPENTVAGSRVQWGHRWVWVGPAMLCWTAKEEGL